MNKSYRQGQILKLIRSRKIFTQEDLARDLNETFGIPATQVTLSRDMRELGLVKTPDGYRQVSAPTGVDLATAAAEFLWDVRSAQNLVVLKTSPGHASSLAVAIDRSELPEGRRNASGRRHDSSRLLRTRRWRRRYKTSCCDLCEPNRTEFSLTNQNTNLAPNCSVRVRLDCAVI